MIHPKESLYTDWLRWFTKFEIEDGIGKPFDLNDGWQAATNGYIGIVAKKKDVTYSTLDHRRADTIIKIMSGLTEIKPEDGDKVFGPELAGIVGECIHPIKKTCSRCGGKGVVTHYCDCDLCEEDEEKCFDCYGKGDDFEVEKRCAKILGLCVDANLVAYMMDHAPRQDEYRLRIGNSPDNKQKILLVITKEWVGCVPELIAK